MLRAVVMASRLGFDLDPLVVEAIAEHRALIATASPARLLEEYYKILRSGYAEATFRGLGRARLLELITPELKSPPDAFWDWLARLDRYRGTFPSAPPSLTNTVLIGALLVPTGILDRPVSGRAGGPDRVDFGMLQVARKDVERLRQIIQMVPRMADPVLPPRVLARPPAPIGVRRRVDVAPGVQRRPRPGGALDQHGEPGQPGQSGSAADDARGSPAPASPARGGTGRRGRVPETPPASPPAWASPRWRRQPSAELID